MTKNDYPALELESEFPADFLRQLPFAVLMLPELLRRPFTKASVFPVQNGRGEPYHRLDISVPLPSGRYTTIREFCLGPLDDAQLTLVTRLIAAYQNRMNTDPQSALDTAMKIIRQYDWVSRQACRLAKVFAAEAGFRLHGSRLRKSANQQHMERPSVETFPANMTARAFHDARDMTECLQGYACDTTTPPAELLGECLCIIHAIADTTVRHLEDILHDVALERIQMVSSLGYCQPLTKRETRAVIKLEKTRRYLTGLRPSMYRLGQCLEEVEAA